MIRHDWSAAEIQAVHDQTFPDLIYEAQEVHRRCFVPDLVQRATLLSLKTGACPEDCAYCSQSAHNCSEIDVQPLLPLETVIAAAQSAKAEGSSRFCMSAAWRAVEEGPEFEAVLSMVRAAAAEGLEICCTFGMLNPSQARRLKEAGCEYYNHNLDTSPEYYSKIITTRTYRDRLRTLRCLRDAGIKLCTGGIIGMGEQPADRFELLRQLAAQQPHPESVQINMLMPVPGTPLADCPPLDIFEFVRLIATARIVLPQSIVRIAAGRRQLSDEGQALCFLAGANSIFTGEKLLTAPNPAEEEDLRLLKRLGLEFAPEADLRLTTPERTPETPLK